MILDISTKPLTFSGTLRGKRIEIFTLSAQLKTTCIQVFPESGTDFQSIFTPDTKFKLETLS